MEQPGPCVRADPRTVPAFTVTGPPVQEGSAMTAEEATSLFRLRCVWGDRFRIDLNADGIWIARNNVEMLTADTAEALKLLMQNARRSI